MQQDYFGAFRAQLAMPAQRQLFDYWLSKCQGKAMPNRADLKPQEIPKLLANISIISVAAEAKFSTIRLAGTGLRELHDCDITGQTLADVDWDQNCEYWNTAYHNTIVHGEPTHGIMRAPSSDRNHLDRVWLRLPLSTINFEKVDMILGFDALIRAQQERGFYKKAI